MWSNSRSLTVVVIAHNDEKTLADTIERVYRALKVTVEDFCVVIFDDGSNDDTWQIAEGLCEKYPFLLTRRNARRMGLGYCTIEASHKATTAFIVYVPADNTWPARSLLHLFGNIGKADVVTSYSTNLLGAMPLPKRMISRAYTLILNTLFRKKLHYYNGLTVYPVEYLRQDPVGTRGFGFQAEALIKAVTAGNSFLEIILPVDTANLPSARAVTPANALNAFATILRLLFELYVLPRPHLKPQSALRVDELGAGRPTEMLVGAPAAAGSHARAPLRIVIMGGSSGMGATLARALAQEGHLLFICARRADHLREVAGNSPAIRPYVCDVTDEKQVADFVSRLSGDTEFVDVLINSVGGFGEIGPIYKTDTDAWWRTLEVNVKGTYLMIKHLLPLLEKGRAPRILNFAGGGAFSPFPNYSAYACSKTAVVRLTECLADELRPKGICINALAPGFVATEMHTATLAAGEDRAGRMQFQRTQAILDQGAGGMDKVVNCVRSLISPAMDHLTGKTISSNFDPWQTPAFEEMVSEISRSDLYTLRRINVVNLPDGRLRTTLSEPWADSLAAD